MEEIEDVKGELDSIIKDVEKIRDGDATKFMEGNKSASTRVRKQLMAVRDRCQKLRQAIIGIRDNM